MGACLSHSRAGRRPRVSVPAVRRDTRSGLDWWLHRRRFRLRTHRAVQPSATACSPSSTWGRRCDQAARMRRSPLETSRVSISVGPWFRTRRATVILVLAWIGVTAWLVDYASSAFGNSGLTVTITRVGDGRVRVYSLRCGSPEGSLPNASAACDALDAWQNYHSFSYFGEPLNNVCARTPGDVVVAIAGKDVTTHYDDIDVAIDLGCPMKADQRALWRTAAGLEPSLPTIARPPGFHAADAIRYSRWPELLMLGASFILLTGELTRRAIVWRRG
jgi:hypothetical protein